MDRPTGAARIMASFTAVTAWLALLLQYFLFIDNAARLTALQVTGRYFNYFTILTNFLVAFSITVTLITDGRIARFFARIPVRTAIAVYIFTVGLGYNLLLRHAWSPRGWQLLADELLHDAVPLLYVAYWAVFVRRASLPWQLLPYWMIYPVAYAAITLWRGNIDGFYPYPFVDVQQLGYQTVLRNMGGLFIAMLLISALFIRVNSMKRKEIRSDLHRI